MTVKSILIFIPCLLGSIAQAQTLSEWFAQKSTQKKYLLQQIAALQVYSTYLKKGYSIARGGLGSISSSLKSENGLHTVYYNRLKTADPAVKNNSMVNDIIAWQKDILNRLQAMNKISGFTADEKSYLNAVGEALLKDCDQQLNNLQSVISDGKTEMSDAERLELITKIHTVMMENYLFSSDFATQAKVYVLRRQQEQNDVNAAKRVYGIN